MLMTYSSSELIQQVMKPLHVESFPNWVVVQRLHAGI
jgi:hypothetical protein